MSFYAFSDAMISASIRAGDGNRYGVDLKADRETIVSDIKQRANDIVKPHGPHSLSYFKKRACVLTADYPTVVVLRCLSRYIAKRFRVRLPDRNDIMNSVVVTLSDHTPMYIYRRDIKSFYESIDISATRDALNADQSISKNARGQISIFYSQHSPSNIGLPRGVSLSPVLAEWALQDYDKRIKRVPGVYRYFRYCDDILVFSTTESKELDDELQNLPGGLCLNTEKSCNQFAVGDSNGFEFEYLGYRVKADHQKQTDQPRKFEIHISNRSMKRIKSKISLAVAAYNSTADWDLFRDRVRYLTGNYRVMRLGITHNKEAKYIKAGIRYSYAHCGSYVGAVRTSLRSSSIDQLDTFLSCVTRNSKTKMSRTFHNSISHGQHDEIKRLSFRAGFETPIVVRFDDMRTREINHIWKTL